MRLDPGATRPIIHGALRSDGAGAGIQSLPLSLFCGFRVRSRREGLMVWWIPSVVSEVCPVQDAPQ